MIPAQAQIFMADLLGNPAAIQGLNWQPFREGIEAVWLYQTAGGGPASALLRYHPGASSPQHRHAGWEHIILLEGSQSDATASYGVGSFVANPPGSEHCVFSQEGCVALLIWERAPQFMDV